MNSTSTILQELGQVFDDITFVPQSTRDDIPTLWVVKDEAHKMLRYLKTDASQPFLMLYDLTAIDARVRNDRDGGPPGDFSVVYHLISFVRHQDLRLNVPLEG